MTTRSVCISACALLALVRSAREEPRATLAPEMVGEGTVSTSADEFGGTLSADGRSLYFTRSIPPHYLYAVCVSKMNHGKWSQPELLPFSGVWRDSDPVLSPDGRRLYFVSDRPVCAVPAGAASTQRVKRMCQDRHNFDIYVSKLVGGHWRDPERLPEWQSLLHIGPRGKPGCGRLCCALREWQVRGPGESRKPGKWRPYCKHRSVCRAR